MKKLDIYLLTFVVLIAGISEVDGLIPVTYSCCQDYSYSNGTILEDFESAPMYPVESFEAVPTYTIDNFDNIGNWSVGESGILENDTENFRNGQGLKLTANGSRAILDKSINENFANATVSLWIYIYDISTFNEGTIYFSSTNNFSKYFVKSIQYLNQGWNKVTFDKESFGNYKGEDWNNTMQIVRLALYPITGNSTSITFDDLEYNLNPDWQSLVGFVEGDTVNYLEGNQGLKITTQANTNCFNGFNCGIAEKVINKDFKNFTDFSLWLYVEDPSAFYQGSLFLTSNGSNWAKYFSISLQNVHQGWNNLILDRTSFKNNNNEDWNNTMNRIRLITYSQPGQIANATFDDLQYYDQYVWAGSAGIIMPDTIQYKDGKQGLKFVSINGSEVQADKTIDLNLKNVNNFAFWVYVDNASNLGYIRLILTSTGSAFSSYFYDSFGKYGYDSSLRNGWNEIVFNKAAFKNGFGESWDNMNKIRLDIAANPGKDVNVTVDNLRYNLTGSRAKLFIEFDDGWESTFTKAYPVLKSNNVNATVFIVPKYVGATNYMNFNQIKTLQSAGWDIGSHSFSHPDLTSMNDSRLSYELNASSDWLINNNFQKSSRYIAYPFGTYSTRTLDFVEKRYLLGRSTQWESAVQHFKEDPSVWLVQRIITVEYSPSVNYTNPEWLIQNINDTINSGLLGIIVFHDIYNDTEPPRDIYAYSLKNFTKVINYIKSRSADIDVIKESDYVIANIRNFTPVINKSTLIYSNGSTKLITINSYDEYMPNMTVSPSSGYNITVNSYNESGGLVRFNESPEVDNDNVSVTYDIGDRIPDTLYTVKIWDNGTLYQNFGVLSNNTGYIKYNSTLQDSRYQIITKGGVIEPKIISWKNSKTNDNNLTIDISNGESVKFNITTDQKIDTWKWSKDGIVLQNNYDNLTTSWTSNGKKTLSINGTNTNGTTNTVIWNINVNGKIYITSCGLLNDANGYILNASVSSNGTCFTIGANNITLEGSWNTVNYAKTGRGYGILDYGGYDNITIKNITLSQQNNAAVSSHGIYLVNVINSLLSDIKINTKNNSKGMYLSSSVSNTFSNFDIKTVDNNAHGIYMNASNNNAFSTFNILTYGGSAYGLYIENGKNNNFLKMNVVSGGNGIRFNSATSNIMTYGSIDSTLTNDYYLQNSGTANYFLGTNFTTTRKIYLYDNTSKFNYGLYGIRLGTLQQVSPSSALTITRTFTNWDQKNVSWLETLSASRKINYGMRGLLVNTSYSVWVDSTKYFSLKTDAAGYLPSFSISLNTSRRLIKVVTP